MTTEEFYSNPLMGTWLRALNTVPVDRSRPDHRALRVGVERLRAGRIVGVFPEGGIRAALARIAGVPIIPSVIFGADRLYAPRSWLPGPPRAKVWIAIGPPLSVSDASGRQANARLVEALREIGAAAITHFALSPDDLPATPQRRKGRDAQPTA